MTDELKRMIIGILEKDKDSDNFDPIADEIVDKLVSLTKKSNQNPFYIYSLGKRLSSMESKLDTILENSTIIRKCEFYDDSVIHLMIAKDEREKGIQYLSDKLKDAISLVICDPYFFNISNEKAEEFIKLLPESLKCIHVYSNSINGERADNLYEKLTAKDICLKRNKRCDIHDRVWIKDNKEAFVVGTSFNGLGNQCVFILDLPEEERKEFTEMLHERSQ